MAGVQAASALGSFITEYADRLVRQAARELKYELETGVSRQERKAGLAAHIESLGSLLLERGDDAPRLWAEQVRHHGGSRFEAKRPFADLTREFRVLLDVILQEWARRVGPMDADLTALLNDCIFAGMSAAATDYLRRMKSDRVEFRESALIETILEHLDEGIILLEADGTLSFVTRPAVGVLGAQLLAIVGKSVDEGNVEELLRALKAETLEGVPVSAEDLPGTRVWRTRREALPVMMRVHKGQDERLVELSALPIWDEEKPESGPRGLRGVITTVRDRTDEIRRSLALRDAYRELTSLHERLVQRTRHQAMGELAAGAAHALNNLLNAMKLRLRLLKESPAPEHLDALGRTINDVATLVARLQEFPGGRPAGAPEPVNLDEVVQQALELVRPEQRGDKRAVTVERRLGGAGQIEANPAELREVIVNLLLYARDQLSESGRLHVETRATADGAECVIRFRASGAAGHGEEYFEPFALTEAPSAITFGVSNARSVLGRWGGEVRARLAAGGEAEFRLALKRAKTVRVPLPTTTPVGTGPRRILVIDDDRDNANMLAEVLVSEGHHVVTAETGEEAIAKWGEVEFEAALIDLVMPDMPGTEIAARLAQTRPNARLALVTGWELSAEERQKAPVHSIFRKPVDVDALLAFLQQPGLPAAPAAAPAPAPA